MSQAAVDLLQGGAGKPPLSPETLLLYKVCLFVLLSCPVWDLPLDFFSSAEHLAVVSELLPVRLRSLGMAASRFNFRRCLGAARLDGSSHRRCGDRR